MVGAMKTEARPLTTVAASVAATATPSPSSSPVIAPPGLKGVIVADTEIGDVRGAEGFYHYRQYSAVDLAQTRSLEDVWLLLVEGHLPSPAEHDAFVAEI